MDARDYIDMPKLVVNDLWIDLPTDVQAEYRNLEDEMFAALETATDGMLIALPVG